MKLYTKYGDEIQYLLSPKQTIILNARAFNEWFWNGLYWITGKRWIEINHQQVKDATHRVNVIYERNVFGRTRIRIDKWKRDPITDSLIDLIKSTGMVTVDLNRQFWSGGDATIPVIPKFQTIDTKE